MSKFFEPIKVEGCYRHVPGKRILGLEEVTAWLYSNYGKAELHLGLKLKPLFGKASFVDEAFYDWKSHLHRIFV